MSRPEPGVAAEEPQAGNVCLADPEAALSGYERDYDKKKGIANDGHT